MRTELDGQVQQEEKRIRVKIDDYKDSISAILGFCSLWFFDTTTGQNQPHIRVFQGRRLSLACTYNQSGDPQSQNNVCPDLGIVAREQNGILGEVKKNFPRNDDRRQRKIFDQLRSYDQELMGWPTHSGEIESHSLVLLVHQTTSRAAQDAYGRLAKEDALEFARPFSIVQFNRSDQSQSYFFFQAVQGVVDEIKDGIDLHNGTQVPMQALMEPHAKSKLYDAEPPLAYLSSLIWEHVIVDLASEEPKFARLRSNQKLEINVSIEDIVQKLHEGFSFSHWHKKFKDRQPQVPRKEWVQKACRFLVESKEARWVTENTELLVFYRKYNDIHKHFVALQAESEAGKRLHRMFPGFEAGHPDNND